MRDALKMAENFVAGTNMHDDEREAFVEVFERLRSAEETLRDAEERLESTEPNAVELVLDHIRAHFSRFKEDA